MSKQTETTFETEWPSVPTITTNVTSRDDGIPIIPKLPEEHNRFDPNPTIAVCGECGLKLKRVMGYVCSNARCPTGLGGRNVC